MTHTLIARLDNAGDVLLAGPAIRAVARRHRVTLVCSERGRAAGALLPGVDELLTMPAPWIEAEPPAVDERAVDAFVRAVARRHVDEAAVLVSSHQSPLPLALLLRLAGVRRIAAISHDYAGSLLDVRIAGDPDVHEVERNLMTVRALGHGLGDGDDRLAITRAPTTVVAGTAADAEGAVVLHPGASVPARTWPIARWQLLARALVARGHRVLVTGGPHERGLTNAIATAAPGSIDLGGTTELAGLAEILAAAAVVCCGNTGPAHVAAAVGTPVVVVFPPTVPLARWHPWRVPYAVIGDQSVACAGCRAKECPVPGQPCLDVPVADAVDAVERLANTKVADIAAVETVAAVGAAS